MPTPDKKLKRAELRRAEANHAWMIHPDTLYTDLWLFAGCYLTGTMPADANPATTVRAFTITRFIRIQCYLYPEQSETLENVDGVSPRRCLTCVILVPSWQMEQCTHPKHKIKKTAVW